jgi:hypothetical protein
LTPVRAPQANAVEERWIGTRRRKCLQHIIPLNERHLRRLVGEFVMYDDETWPHRTLNRDPPEGPRPRQCHGRVVPIPILGGLQDVPQPDDPYFVARQTYEMQFPPQADRWNMPFGGAVAAYRTGRRRCPRGDRCAVPRGPSQGFIARRDRGSGHCC